MKLRMPPRVPPTPATQRSSLPVFKLKRYHIGGSVKGTSQQRHIADPLAKMIEQAAEQHTDYTVGSVILKGTYWLALHERRWIKELDSTIKEGMKLVLTSRQALHSMWEERCDAPRRWIREERERVRKELAMKAWWKSQTKEERVYTGVSEQDLQFCDMEW